MGLEDRRDQNGYRIYVPAKWSELDRRLHEENTTQRDNSRSHCVYMHW